MNRLLDMKKLLPFLVFIALISCSPQSGQRPKVLAHRGLCSTGTEFTTDENTLDALIRAQEKGCEGVEFDVFITVDSQLVIKHDDEIVKGELCCTRSPFEEIRAYVLPFGHQIPTLREWLEQAKKTPGMMQFLEIKAQDNDKERELIRRALAIIKELDMMDQVYILSFKSETLDEVLRQEPRMRVGLNSSSLHGSMPPQEVKEHGFAGVSYNSNVILNHPDWIREFQELGIDTFLWMVNSKYMKKIGEDLGFTWMTTDFYDEIGY